MKQTGKGIQADNLQEFLDSAHNAAKEGQQQFFTPLALATALCRPLPAVRRSLVADLTFGSGTLATASGATTALGVEIDSRVKSALTAPAETAWHIENADLTHWYPLAKEGGISLPFILLNPPFSLQWHKDRLAALADSHIPAVAAAFRSVKGLYIDSTLASFLIALDLLSGIGEGFLICNGDTARRLIGDPSDPSHPSDLLRHIWLWLEIPALVFENQMRSFPTAVLYFSNSHGRSRSDDGPLFLQSPSADPTTVERTLMVPEVFSAHCGSRFRYEHEIGARDTVEKFKVIGREYGQRHRGNRPDFNIMLDERGRLRTHLTPFQKISRKIPLDLASRLNDLNLKTPISLCVTATSRTAMREAVQSGIWNVQPEVHHAIAAALREFESHGAPFYTPSPVQALGWVDEYSHLTCAKPGIGDIRPGDSRPITCTVEPTTWKGEKINLAGEPEDLEFTGRELLVTIPDHSDCKHHFHARRDDAKQDPEMEHGKCKARHWHIADLVDHFEIPMPQDIVTLHPERYQAHLATMEKLQARVNKNLSKAS